MNKIIGSSDSLKDEVYDYIYSSIINNHVRPSEKISVSLICNALKVSRTPVREALIELAKEGYLERIPHRGFRLRVIGLDELRDIYTIIGCLEGYAASLASAKMSREDFGFLQKLIEDMEQAIDEERINDYYDLQLAFHDRIILSSKNPRLYEFVSLIKRRYIRPVYNLLKQKKGFFLILRQTNSEHKKILKMLLNDKANELELFLRNTHWHIS